MSHDIRTPALNLTSLVSKKTRRAKARLMQNFGKADKTTDELFEVYQLNFARQQSTALNLQKHVKHYAQCLKELHDSSKSLSQCLLDMHERDWPKHDVYENNAYELNHISEDLEEKIKESVLVPLEQYLGQFAEIREKIAKRGRKLVDYDSQRHHFEALQQHHSNKQSSNTLTSSGLTTSSATGHHSANVNATSATNATTTTTTTTSSSATPHDDSKLNKSREQLDEARRVYENLNNELHDELPALYDNRIPFVITVFQRLFSSNLAYHTENAALDKSYLDTVELLARATEKGALGSHHHHQQQQQQPPRPNSQLHQHHNPYDARQVNTVDSGPPSVATITLGGNTANNKKSSAAPSDTASSAAKQPSAALVGDSVQPEVGAPTQDNNNKPGQDGKGPVYLHKVKATYKYLAEDEDELTFEAGEIIQVIEYDDPQEQEEGWLMGIRELTGQKGLFPANFTKDLKQ